MESPRTNHPFLVKHLYKDCELLKQFLRKSSKMKERRSKEEMAKEDAAGKDGDNFPEPRPAS